MNILRIKYIDSQGDVHKVEKISTEKSLLPDYFGKHIPEFLEKVAKLQTDQTVNFIFYTDPHHHLSGNQLHTVQAIQSISSQLPLDFIMVGGDISTNGEKEKFMAAQREITEELKKCSVPVLMVKGNHDDNSIYDFHYNRGSMENVVFPEETYEIICKHLEETVAFDGDNRSGLYFYYDIPERQTRIIALNCIDIPYRKTDEGSLKYNGQWKYAFSDQQLNWMAHEALNFQGKADGEAWNVIVFSHVAILQDDVFGADHPVVNGQVMWDILKAFQLGEVYQSTLSDGDFAQSVSVDFRNQGAHNIFGSFFGHVHHDQGFVRDQLLMISTLNAVTGRDFDISPDREGGTISETAFDVVTVNPLQRKIFLTRFGAGEDRIYDLP